jgi:hypothetical protein
MNFKQDFVCITTSAPGHLNRVPRVCYIHLDITKTPTKFISKSICVAHSCIVDLNAVTMLYITKCQQIHFKLIFLIIIVIKAFI